MRRRTPAILLSLAAVCLFGGATGQLEENVENELRIRFKVGGDELLATLDDSVASREFIALLPLELTLTDYNDTEKIAYLPARLPTEGSPDGVDPDVGDITYYAPWGNLAIFYRDFGYSRGLIKLGSFDGDIAFLRQPGELNATIELGE